MARRIKVTKSTGNVFQDLGFDKDEAKALLRRSQLMIQLIRKLKSKGLTQKQLGLELSIGQSRVSDLLKGKSELFSLDMIFTLADRAGLDLGDGFSERPVKAYAASTAAATAEVATSWVIYIPSSGVGPMWKISRDPAITGNQSPQGRSDHYLHIWDGSSYSALLARVTDSDDKRMAA